MKIRYILFVTVTLYVASQIAFAQKRPDKTTNGKITFKAKNAGLDVIGTLDIIDLNILIDENNLAQSHVIATADPRSINTGIKIRDNHLRKSDYFDVTTHPVIKLQSIQLTRAGKSLQGVFDLTIKNITKRVTIRFTRKKQDTSVRFEGSFIINRMDYKIGEASSILENNVQIFFDVVQ